MLLHIQLEAQGSMTCLVLITPGIVYPPRRRHDKEEIVRAGEISLLPEKEGAITTVGARIPAPLGASVFPQKR